MSVAGFAAAGVAWFGFGCDQRPDDAAPAPVQPGHAADQHPKAPPLDWRTLEAPLLRNHVQITTRDKFVKAGEQYFSPDSKWLIFQAVPVPPEGKDPDPFYSMYVTRLRRDAAGHITGAGEPIRVSPEGSANSCGWFHPKEPWRVIFGSTLVRPSNEQKAGFQVGTRKYVWMFPDEMEVVQASVGAIRGDYPNQAGSPDIRDFVPKGCFTPGEGSKFVYPIPDSFIGPLFEREHYDAECSYSKDGRFVLYAHVTTEKVADRPDADIFVYDTVTEQHHVLVRAIGYDGGPFFSPDSKMICYRSDRLLDDLLQLYVAEVVYDKDGVPTGTTNEIQLTSNLEVNWCPFWHPSGKFLVYGNSGADHTNYEVDAVEVDPGKPPQELRHRRITFADGADILPVFSTDGKLMAWASQRGPMIDGETKPSTQVWIAECVPGGFDDPGRLFPPTQPSEESAAVAKAVAFLRHDEDQRRKASTSTNFPESDYSRPKATRIKNGWSVVVNPWNVPDGDKEVLVYDTGYLGRGKPRP